MSSNFMAKAGLKAAVASPSPAANLCKTSTNPMASMGTTNRLRQAQRTLSSSSGDEDISMNYNTSTVASDQTDNCIWNQILLGGGSCSEANERNGYSDGEKFHELISFKTLTNQVFSKTGYSSDLNPFEKQLNEFNEEDMIDAERITTNLSNLVGNWSIAPPDQHHMSSYTSSTVYNDINSPWSVSRNLSDFVCFSPVNKQGMEFRGCEGTEKTRNESSHNTKESRRNSGTFRERKKKRVDECSSMTLFKKSKHESSNDSTLKQLHVAKVKVGEKITTLQQLVSPFGKTDTASVLLEAINYIRFLQEQIQDYITWKKLERKEKAELQPDLRSKGLCLMPISSAPQIYKETNGPEYWTPTYRGFFYR